MDSRLGNNAASSEQTSIEHISETNAPNAPTLVPSTVGRRPTPQASKNAAFKGKGIMWGVLWAPLTVSVSCAVANFNKTSLLMVLLATTFLQLATWYALVVPAIFLKEGMQVKRHFVFLAFILISIASWFTALMTYFFVQDNESSDKWLQLWLFLSGFALVPAVVQLQTSNNHGNTSCSNAGLEAGIVKLSDIPDTTESFGSRTQVSTLEHHSN